VALGLNIFLSKAETDMSEDDERLHKRNRFTVASACDVGASSSTNCCQTRPASSNRDNDVRFMSLELDSDGGLPPVATTVPRIKIFETKFKSRIWSLYVTVF